MTCVSHNLHLVHIVDQYLVYKDDNDLKPQKHIFHNFCLMCKNCDFTMTIESLSDQIHPIEELYRDEFEELLKERQMVGDN